MNKNEAVLNDLRNITGDDLYRKICECLGGSRLYIPYYTGYKSKAERNRSIVDDYRSGLSWDDLISKYGLSISQIQHIVYDKSRHDF